MSVLRSLLVLGILLTAASFGSDALSNIAGPFDYKGYISFAYGEGESPINHIQFTVENIIAPNLLIINVPNGWSHSYNNGVLTLFGGLLNPGETVNVQVSLNRYQKPGSYEVDAIGATIRGESIYSGGSILIGELYILMFLAILGTFRYLFLVSTLGLGFFYIYKRYWRKPPPVRVPTLNPPHVDMDKKDLSSGDEGLSYPIGEDDNVSRPEGMLKDPVSRKCECSYEWKHQSTELDIVPTEIVKRFPDDPLPLRAIATDRHILLHKCNCPISETTASKAYTMSANVRIDWEMMRGEGGFIKLNDETPSDRTTGECVLYQPPDIEDVRDEKNVMIKVTVHHIDTTKPPDHDPVEAFIEMRIKRETTEEGQSRETKYEFTDPGLVKDEYKYEFIVTKGFLAGDHLPKDLNLDCIPEKEWQEGSEIEGEIIHAPREVVYGDFVKLEANAFDTDNIQLKCVPQRVTCIEPSKTIILTVSDQLDYIWSADKGIFPRDNTGKETIWQAPDDEGEVRIILTIKDKTEQFPDKKIEKKTVIKVQKLGIGLVKTPKAWLPIGTAGELLVPARTYICKNGKWTLPGRKKFIRAKLTFISREPGVCVNYPQNGNKNPDLFFYKEKMENEFLLLRDKTVTKNCPTEIIRPNDNPTHDVHHLYSIIKKRNHVANLVIRCEDYGAFGNLCIMANHSVDIYPLEKVNDGYQDCREGISDIRIPRDADGNEIADSASQNGNGADAKEDEDSNPVGDRYAGDGLTNYEEYRGFIVQGKRMVTIPTPTGQIQVQVGFMKRFIRTDIGVKDVFIYDEDNLGTGLLNVTGLDIHLIYDPALFNGTNSRVINFNNGKHNGGEQHGLWLRDARLYIFYGLSCYVNRALGVNGPPRVKTHVCIDTQLVISSGHPPNFLSSLIAHELCHGLNIWHHGEGGNHRCDSNGRRSTCRRRGVTSGNMDCIMRYSGYTTGWCHEDPHHAHLYVTLTQNPTGTITRNFLDSPGTILCDSSFATGLNDAGIGHRNPAILGNCKGQLRVKDW